MAPPSTKTSTAVTRTVDLLSTCSCRNGRLHSGTAVFCYPSPRQQPRFAGHAPLVDIGPGQEVDKRKQCTEDEARLAVEEPQAHEEGKTKRTSGASATQVYFSSARLQPLAPSDPLGNRLVEKSIVHGRLPRRRSGCASQPGGDVGIGMMLELMAEPKSRPSQLDMLVGFVVAVVLPYRPGIFS